MRYRTGIHAELRRARLVRHTTWLTVDGAPVAALHADRGCPSLTDSLAGGVAREVSAGDLETGSWFPPGRRTVACGCTVSGVGADDLARAEWISLTCDVLEHADAVNVGALRRRLCAPVTAVGPLASRIEELTGRLRAAEAAAAVSATTLAKWIDWLRIDARYAADASRGCPRLDRDVFAAASDLAAALRSAGNLTGAQLQGAVRLLRTHRIWVELDDTYTETAAVLYDRALDFDPAEPGLLLVPATALYTASVHRATWDEGYTRAEVSQAREVAGDGAPLAGVIAAIRAA